MVDRSIPFDPDVEMMRDHPDDPETPGSPWENETGFVLQWAAKGWGFGTLSFFRREELGGKLYCGDEYMKRDTCALILRKYAEATPREQWTPLLKAFGSVEALMADVVEWESKPREQSEP